MKKINNLKINQSKIKELTKVLLSLCLVGTLTACQQNNKVNNSNEDVKDEPIQEQTNDSEIINHTNENGENAVVNYFDSLKEEFSQITDFSSEDVKNWAFDKLETTVNFVTNKEPIGGIYFKDLTGTAKGTVIGTLSYMDEKLMYLCPDYKEKASAVFDKTKEELTAFKESIETSIEEQIGKERYNQIKENVKNEFANLKEKVKENYTKAKEKIKEWYTNNTH